MQILEALTLRYRDSGLVIREFRNHAFVVFGIPGRGSDEGFELGLVKVLNDRKTIGLGSHADDPSGGLGWTSCASGIRL